MDALMLPFGDDLRKPAIVHADLCEDLGDAPGQHRWRAQWYDTYDHDYGGHSVIGILLVAYPVVKLTPCGAWIDKHPYRQRTASGIKWEYSEARRWVSNDGGAAFAKPTQEQALHSIAYRLMRWHSKTIRDVKRLREAAAVCKAVLPQHAHFTQGVDSAF